MNIDPYPNANQILSESLDERPALPSTPGQLLDAALASTWRWQSQIVQNGTLMLWLDRDSSRTGWVEQAPGDGAPRLLLCNQSRRLMFDAETVRSVYEIEHLIYHAKNHGLDALAHADLIRAFHDLLTRLA